MFSLPIHDACCLRNSHRPYTELPLISFTLIQILVNFGAYLVNYLLIVYIRHPLVHVATASLSFKATVCTRLHLPVPPVVQTSRSLLSLANMHQS